MNHLAKLLGMILAVTPISVSGCVTGDSKNLMPASSLPDLSGMVWLKGDWFLAVHDSKNPGELDRPRVSLLKLPQDLEGLLWQPLTVQHWPGGASNDLESAARIPGTQDVLLLESGDNGDNRFRRIFLARIDAPRLKIMASTPWPVSIYNVEASAVTRVGNGFVFLYAERAELKPETRIRWATFDPDTLTFGDFHSVTLSNPDPVRTNRPVVAMDIGHQGEIYIASAFDPEAEKLPNPDNGPFASSVWLVGKIQHDSEGVPTVTLLKTPRHQATLEGLKVESVSLREIPGKATDLFIGLDDENYGATMRLLPPHVEDDQD